MILEAGNLDHRALNQKIRQAGGDVELIGCCGQRFIAAGLKNKRIAIDGIPGNALGAYLDGAVVEVRANAQDAVGDTMNDGSIIVHGSVGDAAGYAMRGGSIYVRGNAGYRAGIHMKEYGDKIPVMIIGGSAGSFLGEYQAGGVIVVLGMEDSGRRIVGDFPCTGMHGGRVFLRSGAVPVPLPKNVCARPAAPSDLEGIRKALTEYCKAFGWDAAAVLRSPFTLITPDSRNPYKQMYVAN